MEIPKIEQDFINWCAYIHPDINPYLFFRRHTRYYDEYAPFLEDLMVHLHEELWLKVLRNFSLINILQMKMK